MRRYRVTCMVPVMAEVDAEDSDGAWEAFLGSSQCDVTAADGAEDIRIECIGEGEEE